MIRIKFILLFILLFTLNLPAQNASSREWTIFRSGISQYQKANYEKALQSFSLMLNKLPNSALTTANLLMLAKTNYKMGNYQVSLVQCAEFTKKFPNSTYLDDIGYLRANNYYRMGRLQNAAVEWFDLALSAKKKIIHDKALKLANNLIDYKLNRILLEKMAQSANSGIKPIIVYYIARKYWQNGNPGLARKTLAPALAHIQDINFKDKAEELNDQLNGRARNEIEVAVLLPITGPNAEIGTQLLNGLQLAVDGYNKSAAKPVNLHVYDYSSRLITALELMDKIASDGNALFIFGPVENDITAACAAVAKYKGITLVSPTATRNGISALSPNCILLAPSVKTMGQSIAAFAMDSLKLKRFASLAPMDDYFTEMTDGFTSTIEALGGSIPAQEWYYPGDQNFKKQFQIIKRIGLKLTFTDSIHQTQADISENDLDSLYAEYKQNKRDELKETKTQLDSADISVDTFDGFFLPLFKDDISYLASQFAYSNFHTQLLGNADWYDPQVLKRNKNYIRGLIFVSDGYLNEESWDYRQFRNNYRNKYKQTPDRFALIGFDGFNFLSGALQHNPYLTKENITGKIIKLKPYQGIYRRIIMANGRENKSIRLLKFMYGQILPIR